MASPAEVLRQYLIDLGAVVLPRNVADGLWPCVVGPLPPDTPNYVGLINTAPYSQGRLQDSGQRVVHPRVQVVVRAVDDGTGYDKGAELQAIFDKVGVPTTAGGNGQIVPVAVRGHDFALTAVHTKVPLTPVGAEPDTGRALFTINLQLELTQTTPDTYRAVYMQASPPVDYVLGFQNGYLFRFTPAALLSVMLPANTQGVLENDGAGNLSWQAGGGGGSVTSVGLSLPGIFTVAGSPVTTTGTLSASLATQTANRVWAGPTTGAASAPTFRALVAADLPAGTGTVTSVGLTLPNIFTVSGSPVTAAGTLAAVLATQAAHTFWAGPTTGPNAAPTFRAIQAADVPGTFLQSLVLDSFLVVCGTTGDDSTGAVGRLDKPFKTLTAARTAAVTAGGGLVSVMPGTYDEHDLLRTGVNWDFAAGAVVNYTGSDANLAIFDDTAGACVCAITGRGTFTNNDTGSGVRVGVVAVSNASSSVLLEGDTLTGNAAAGIAVVYQSAGTLVVRARVVQATGTQELAVWWAGGDGRVTAELISSNGANTIFTTASTVESLWITCDRLTFTGPTGGGQSGVQLSGTSNARVWITAKEIRSSADGVVVTGGKNYLLGPVGKISAAGLPFKQSGGTTWAYVQKITPDTTSPGITVSGGTAFFTVQQIEDLGTMLKAVSVTGGALTLNGTVTSMAAGDGVVCSAGTVTLNGCQVTTAGAAHDLVQSGSGTVVVHAGSAGTNADGTFTTTGTITYRPQRVDAAASPTFAGLTVGSLAGVLKATAGVVAGAATTTDVPEGTNLYYTDARVRLNRLDQLAAPTADVSVNGRKLTNLANGTLTTDAATYGQLTAAVTGVLDFRGSTNCSGNPNYPAAVKGDAYVVSVAGKIGGASGVSVDAGDVYFATADNAGGTQASVGASWSALEHNLVGALLAANNLSDVASAATARTNLGLGNVENTALSTWPGSANVVTIGAVTAGRWQANMIEVVYGGTGANTAGGALTNLGAAASALVITAGTNLSGGGDLTADRTLNVVASPTFTNVSCLSVTGTGASSLLTLIGPVQWFDGGLQRALMDASGNLTVASVAGDGHLLTLLDGGAIASGTVAYAHLPIGTSAGFITAADDARLSDSRTPSGAAGGDLTGTYPNPTVKQPLRGAALAAAALLFY